MHAHLADTPQKTPNWYLAFWRGLGQIMLPLKDGRHWYKPHQGIDDQLVCTLKDGRKFKLVFAEAACVDLQAIPVLVIPNSDPQKSWWVRGRDIMHTSP